MGPLIDWRIWREVRQPSHRQHTTSRTFLWHHLVSTVVAGLNLWVRIRDSQTLWMIWGNVHFSASERHCLFLIPCTSLIGSIPIMHAIFQWINISRFWWRLGWASAPNVFLSGGYSTCTVSPCLEAHQHFHFHTTPEGITPSKRKLGFLSPTFHGRRKPHFNAKRHSSPAIRLSGLVWKVNHSESTPDWLACNRHFTYLFAHKRLLYRG